MKKFYQVILTNIFSKMQIVFLPSPVPTGFVLVLLIKEKTPEDNVYRSQEGFQILYGGSSDKQQCCKKKQV